MNKPEYVDELKKRVAEDPELRKALLTNTIKTLQDHGVKLSEEDLGLLDLPQKAMDPEDVIAGKWLFVKTIIACEGCF